MRTSLLLFLAPALLFACAAAPSGAPADTACVATAPAENPEQGPPQGPPSQAITSPTVVAPVPIAPRVIGYFTNWAHTRAAPCEFQTSDVPAELLTHINYAFASVSASEDRQIFELVPSSPDDLARLYAEVNALKKQRPALETLLSVGGWTFNDKPTEWIFSTMASSAERRGHFIRQATSFLRQHDFDGLDIDWEFPGAQERGGQPADRQNFTALLAEFRAHFHDEAKQSGKKELKLTIASPAGHFFYQHQELGKIHESLDWINVMTYDYHGDWDHVVGDNAPLSDNGPDIEETIAAYVASGVPRGKIVLGFATYARAFGGVEKDARGAAATLPGPTGPCGQDALSAHHVQAWIESGRYQRVWDTRTSTPHAYSKREKAWISYDDAESYRLKLEFLARESLGGAMFWAIDQDDVRSGFPLIRQVSQAVLSAPPPASTLP